MKRLNLNNAIATMAMLTKTNTMKNKMNLFAKVVMLVVMLGMLLPNIAWGQQVWTQPGGANTPWYILNVTDQQISKGWYQTEKDDKSFTVYLPNVTSSGIFDIRCNNGADNSFTAAIKEGSDKKISLSTDSKDYKISQNNFTLTNHNCTTTLTATVTSFKDGLTNLTNNTKIKYAKISIPVPEHADVKNATLSEIDFGEVEAYKTVYHDIEFTSLFTSFMATSGFTLTCSTTTANSGDVFFTDNNASMTSSNICGNYSVYAEPNNTPLSGSAGLVKGSDNKYYLRLYFKPTSSTATYTGNFYLKLGNNTVITIPVKGKGGKISPGLIWTENTDLNVGNSVVNPATVSPDNIEVTYSSADASKIAVNGNTLIALATTEPNKVTITATTTASDDYKSITSTKDFMVTNKQIQSITWNQKFTNLKFGDSDIPLNAIATSGGSITYWVENNSTNVVTITNGILHIVGTGDVKIYAKQAGGLIGVQEWLEVETYKQVKVRAVGAACEECAIESNGEWSSALSSELSETYNVKTKNGLNAPTGNVLKFHYSAGFPAPYYKLTVKVDGETVGTYSADGETADNDAVITLTGANVKENIQNVSFSWKSTSIFGGASLSTVKISEVCLSQLSYLRQGTTTRHDFGNVQFGSSQDVYLENIAKFSALSSTIDAKIVNEGQGFTNASSFKIIDTDGAETDETSIDVDCSDFGNLAINLKYVPQELGNLSAKLRLIGYMGNQQETIYVELHGACFSTPSLEFNNDCFTDKPVFDTNGNYYQQTLSVATNSDATPSYTLVNTPKDVAEIVDDNKLKIKKAGVDITVRAHLDASGYYYERNLDSTFRATTVTPTLNWKTTAMGNKTYHYGQVIDVKDLLTQDYSANEAAKKLPYIAVSAKDAEGNDMFQSETEGNINSAKIKVIRAGVVNSLSASTDAVTNYFNSASVSKTSGCGEIDKASQTITWNDDLTGPYKVNQAPVALTATATSGLDVSYSEGNQGIVSIGTDKNISFAKAGYATVTASQGGNDCCWKAAASSASKSFHVDFADNFFLTCKDATVDNTSDTGFDMTDYFVPSNTSYTVSSSSTEFVVTKQNNSNYITIQFTPTSVNNGSSETQEKEATITITDNGQTYTFKVKAIAEKKDAGLTLEYIGETFAFSTITLSHSEATDAEVTLSASIGNIEDNTYKFRSTEQVTITATVPATNVFKADTKTLNFTPKAVKPRITGWSGNYGAQKVGVSCPLGQADWDVDDNVTGQPAKTEWSTGEVTITYTSSESRIAEVSGSDLVFHRAGLATITASIAEENNHNASTDNPSKSVKVDFADAGVNCGTAYAGETPAVADITDMIVSVGTISDLKTNATSTNPDFKVIVNNDRLEVRFDPSSYHEETSTARITFTDTDGQEYHLNVQGECQKHTPVIEWRSDVQTIAIAQDENDIKTETDLIDATNSQYYQPLKFKSGDVSKVKVYDENYAEAEWGIYLYPIGKGPVTIYAKAEETESHYASAEASEKQFTIIGEAKSKIAWNQNFLRIYNDQVSIPLTAEVQASSNSAPIPGATVTYHLLNVQNNVVTLNGCTLNITAGAIGTAEIYAEFAGNDDYVSCVSETLNIRVIAKPIGGMCEPIHYSDVTSGEATYYFNRSKTSAGEPYFEVEKVEYSYYVKGGNGWVAWAGTTRNIYATLGSKTDTWTGIGGSAGLFADHDGKTSSGNTTITPKNGENPNYISFTGNIGSNSGTNYGRFENIYVTPKSYFRENTDFSNPFAGSDTKVDEETTRTLELGKYSNLSEYTIQLWDYELNQAYSGGEFSIIDGGSSDHYPDGCNDYGNWIITVKFKPTSGKPEKVHKCKIQITYKRGTDGSNGNFNGFEIEAYASRHTQPDIIWNQDLSSLTSLSTKPTGEHWTSEEPITLTAKSGLSEADYYGTYIAVDRYEITAGTDVAEVNGDQLSIKKAGQFTIKAIHNGDDKYEPTSKERTIDIALSEPTIELSHNGTPIAENETINVTYNDPSITIDSKALYGDFEIYGYTIESGKIELSSSALDVVSIANDNQLQFLKSGDAVITATITEDDVVSSKTFTFYVHVNKAQAGLHWDDVTKYANDWIYVFETKSMTALADNNDNNGAISYDVTSGKASFSGNDITINGYGSITARAIIATTDKYLADTITNTFTPKKVTPVVSWSGSDFTTNLSNSEFTLTDEASVSETTGQPDVSNWTDGKTVVYSSTTPEVATLKQDNTFELHKVGYATIQAKVEAGDNNEASNVVERHLKVDFNPNEPIDFGEVSVYGTKTINFDLSVIKADGGGPVYGSYNTNTTDFSYGMVENGLLPLTFKPQSHDADNPIKTATITIHDGGNNQDYHLVIKGTTALAQPSLKYDSQKYDGWEFVVQLPNTTNEVIYGGSSYDIQWNNFPNPDLKDDELVRMVLSLKNPVYSTYVDIIDHSHFVVKQANEGDDNSIVDVVLVATYPGIENQIAGTSIEIPIKIKKNQYSLNWNKTDGFSIEVYQHSLPLAAPTQTPEGGESVIEYSFSEEGIGTYDGSTFTLIGPPYKSGKLTASIASDKYAVGTSAELDIKVKKTEQTVTWAGNEITNGFTTQKSTTEGIQLTAEAFRGSTKTNANIRYEVFENSNCSGEGDLIRLDVNKKEKPWITTLYYTGNGSGTVSIKAIAEETDEYNESKADDPSASPIVTFDIIREGCNVNSWTVADMYYGDKVTLAPSVDKETRGENYEYTLPPVTGELTTDGNVLEAKGVGSNLTISAKKLEDCWVTESANKPSNTFNIAKSEQEIEWSQLDISAAAIGDVEHQLTVPVAKDKLHTIGEGTWLSTLETDLEVTYDIDQTAATKCSTDAVVVIVDGELKITGRGSGTVTITAQQESGSEYYKPTDAAYEKSIIVTISKITPTITISGAPTGNVGFGTAPMIITAQAVLNGNVVKDYQDIELYTLANNKIKLTTSDPTTVSVTGNNTLNFLKSGSATITATIEADCIVENKVETTFTVTVDRAAQVLKWESWPADETKSITTCDETFEIALDATTTDVNENPTGENNVSYEIVSTNGNCNTALVKIEDNKLTYLDAGSGSVEIKAVVAQSDKYSAIADGESMHRTFVINRCSTDVIVWDGTELNNVHYNDVIVPNADFSELSKKASDKVSISYSVTSGPLNSEFKATGVGAAEITATTGANCYSTGATMAKSFTIQPTTQEIVWTGTELNGLTTGQYANGGKVIELTAKSYDTGAGHDHEETGLDIHYEISDISGESGCENFVMLDPNDNHKLIVTGTGAGRFKITASQKGRVGDGASDKELCYEAATDVTIDVTISKITPTITFDRSNVNDGEEVYYSDPITYTVSSTGTDYSVSDVSAFTFDVTPVDNGAISDNVASHAGNVTIKASQAEDCMINGAESGEVNVEIKKAPQSVSWVVTDLGTLSATSTEGVELTAVAMNSRRNTQSGMTITYTVCDAEGNDITSGALITIGNDNKVYSANNGSGEAWVKAVANGNDNYEASETLVIKKITITNATPTIAWTDPCSEQMTMNYREEKQLTFSCNYTGYIASYSLTETSDDTYVDMTELVKGNVKIIGVKPDNAIGIKVTISDPVGNYSNYELNTAITTQKNNTEIDWNGQSFGTYTTANAGTEIELKAYVKDLFKNDNSGETVSYDFKGTDVVENCGNIVELTDEGKLKITGNAAGTVTLYANYAGNENYNRSTEKSMQITVGKQTPSFAWEDDADIQATYGDVNVSAGEITKDGYGVVTYSSSKEDVATINQDGNITIEGAGTTTLSATLAADCQYEAVTTAITKTLTVNQATGTISWVTGKEPHNGTYLTTLTEEVEATSNNTDDGSIDYSSSNTDVADFENGVLKIYKAGTTIITATRAATRNFTAASCSTTITISKATCTITVTAPQNITFGQTEALQYSTTNNDENLQVTFTSGNTSIVSISGDQATGAGVGTTSVYAVIEESDNYLQATSDDFNITVKQASKTFTIADMSLTYGDQNKPITITDGGITGYTVSYSIADADKSYIEFNQDGTINAIKAHCDVQGNLVNIPVTASFTHDNYTIADATFNVTVAKKSQTITWNETFAGPYDIFSKIMFNATTDADAEASETNKVYYTWTQTSTSTCDVPVFGRKSDNIIDYKEDNGALILAAGEVTVTAHYTGNENYLPADCNDTKTFTIGVGTPNITWNTAFGEGNYNKGETIVLSATSNYNNNESPIIYEIVSMNPTGCATLDNNTNTLTCVAPGKVTVKAYQNAISCKINYSEITQAIQIGQGPHVITWDKSKTYSVTNLAGTIDLSNYCKCSTCSTCLITYSIDGTTGVSLNADGHTLIVDESISETLNVVVTARVAENDTYEASSNDTTFTITVEDLKITVKGGSASDNPLDLSAAEPKVTSVTDTVDMARKLVANGILSSNYKNVTYTFASVDTNIATFANTDSSTIIAYKRSDALKLTVTATVDENRKCSTDFWVKIPRGTMVFNRDGNWDDMLSDGSNWQRRDIKEPSAEDHNVSIAANCTVNDATTAECYDMEIADNGTLTISKAGILNVADTLLNNDASKLRIEADANGQGTLVFHNKKAMPQATVEMWCKGSKTGTGADGGNINPNWQYRGIAVSSATLPSDANAPDLIYQWTEAAHASDAGTGITEQWTKVTGNQMSAWNGYAVAKYTDAEGHGYKTSAAGALTNADQEIPLAYTATQQSGNGVQTGFNLITNSYTAPIRIKDIVFGDETEGVDDVMKGIVLFNTGKYVDWKNSDKGIREGNADPGQYLFLPKYTAEQIATTELIPSGESFFVVAYQTDKTVQIPYSAVEQQVNGALRMPERREVYGKLIIEVDGGEGADRLYLLENENRIRGFENGYDGPKYAGTKGNPMLYATTDDGRMCVSADSSLLGQYIGFAAGKHDVTYTMTFDASALSGYSELYLYDTREKRYTNILDGGSYTFKGLVSGEDRRFKIVGSREDGKSVTGDDQTIIVTGNRFHVTGYDNADERIYLVDMTGKILWETSTAFGPWFDIPTDIPAGVYVIKTGNHTAKMAVK